MGTVWMTAWREGPVCCHWILTLFCSSGESCQDLYIQCACHEIYWSCALESRTRGFVAALETPSLFNVLSLLGCVEISASIWLLGNARVSLHTTFLSSFFFSLSQFDKKMGQWDVKWSWLLPPRGAQGNILAEEWINFTQFNSVSVVGLWPWSCSLHATQTHMPSFQICFPGWLPNYKQNAKHTFQYKLQLLIQLVWEVLMPLTVLDFYFLWEQTLI